MADMNNEIKDMRNKQKDFRKEINLIENYKFKKQFEGVKKEKNGIKDELNNLKKEMERLEKKRRRKNIVISGMLNEINNPEEIKEKVQNLIPENLQVIVSVRGAQNWRRKLA